jgi:hypothetical protein
VSLRFAEEPTGDWMVPSHDCGVLEVLTRLRPVLKNVESNSLSPLRRVSA